MTIAGSIMRKFRSFCRLPFFVKAWLVPALALLLISKVMIFVFSFRRLAPFLGKSNGVEPFLPILRSGQEALVIRIAMLVNISSRYLPLGKSCFPQAITARILLGLYRVPYCIFFGVRRTNRGIDAHAWVFSGAHCVCGGRKSFWRYRVLGVFATHGLLTAGYDKKGESGRF